MGSAETRACPYCAETIRAAAIKCRFCGSAVAPIAQPRPVHPSPVLLSQQQRSPISQNAKIAGGLFFAAFAIGAVLLAVKLAQAKSEPTATNAPRRDVRPTETAVATPSATTPPTPPAPKVETADDKILRLMEAKTPQEAMALLTIGNSGNDVDEGTLAFGAWASSRLRWVHVKDGGDIEHGAVMKNPAKYRGHVACWSGEIVEIHENTSKDGTTMSIGGLYTTQRQLLRYIAAGDSGDLVAGSRARLCGIVTGTQDFTNSAGGSAHAVFAVGIFDTSANRIR